jgi:hypothetical protein
MHELLEHGFVVIDDFIPAAVAAGVASLAQTAVAHDPIRPVGAAGEGCGREADGLPESKVFPWRCPMPRNARGDVTCWLRNYGDEAVAEVGHVAVKGDAVKVVDFKKLKVTDDALWSALVEEGHGHWEPTDVGSSTVTESSGQEVEEGPEKGQSLRNACGDLQTLLARLRCARQDLVTCAIPGRLVGESEVQLSWYAPNGSGYKQHVDALPDDAAAGAGGAQRKVTLLCYCNPHWTEAAGGQLRIHRLDGDGAGTVDIAPKAGRLVAFLSGCMLHEVRPSFADRFAVTAWNW